MKLDAKSIAKRVLGESTVTHHEMLSRKLAQLSPPLFKNKQTEGLL